MKTIKLYTDGGARGNPGPAATGVVIKDDKDKVLKTASQFLGTATNNQAEYEALLQGLEIISKDFKGSQVQVFMDSELIIKQMLGEYRVKDAELKKIYVQVVRLVEKIGEVKFKHIRREKNTEADALVNQTLDTQT
jgi:ribonuclease HI